jgi:hypothetical protein
VLAVQPLKFQDTEHHTVSGVMQPKATPPPPPPRRAKPPAVQDLALSQNNESQATSKPSQTSSESKGDAHRPHGNSVSSASSEDKEAKAANSRIVEEGVKERKTSSSSAVSSHPGSESPRSSATKDHETQPASERPVKFLGEDEGEVASTRPEASDVQDMHGFLLKGTDEFLSSYAGWQKGYSKKQSERGARWSDIIKRSPAAYEKSSALKKLVRKGIPNYLRGRVWMEVTLIRIAHFLVLILPACSTVMSFMRRLRFSSSRSPVLLSCWRHIQACTKASWTRRER